MILLLSENKNNGLRLAYQLIKQGICVLYAKPDAGATLGELRDIGGLILDCRDCVSEKNELLCERLLQADPELPILLLLPRNQVCSIPSASILRAPPQSEEERTGVANFCFQICSCRPYITTHALSLQSPTDIRYMGYPLRLPLREYTLLLFLFFRAPQAVTPGELLAVCFPEGTQRADTLAARISLINRRAAEISPQLPLIECVRGVGYRLRDGIVKQKD